MFRLKSIGESVRARKSPWIETDFRICSCMPSIVRARKSPWIETFTFPQAVLAVLSGLVRARGLKPSAPARFRRSRVRARKSPWIETRERAYGAVFFMVRARKSPWIETRIPTWDDMCVRQGS